MILSNGTEVFTKPYRKKGTEEISISSFWRSLTESILLTIFVLPEFHGQGIGKKPDLKIYTNSKG